MKKIIILAFLMLSNVICVAQESVVLKYNYKKGDKYLMQMSLKQEMGIAGGMTMAMKTEMNVAEKTSEGFKLANKVKKINVNMLQGGKEMNFDTEMKDEELDAEGKKLKAQFDPLMKAVSYMTFDKRGKMLSVKMEPDVLGTNQNSSQGLMTYSVFPEEAVKVGSTWTNEQDIQGMKLKMIYTVKKITSTSVVTEISGTINMMGITGKITGSATFDRETGNTDQMKMDTSISMQGMTMSMGTEATIKKIN